MRCKVVITAGFGTVSGKKDHFGRFYMKIGRLQAELRVLNNNFSALETIALICSVGFSDVYGAQLVLTCSLCEESFAHTKLSQGLLPF